MSLLRSELTDPLWENYAAFFVAIISPVNMRAEEAFKIVRGKKSFPKEEPVTRTVICDLARMLSVKKPCMQFDRLERRYHINAHTIQSIVRLLRKTSVKR